MTDGSRQTADVASGPEQGDGDGSDRVETLHDLGADIGSRKWFSDASRLILLITLALGAGALATTTRPGLSAPHTNKIAAHAPFPLTLDTTQVRLTGAPDMVPVLRTALKLDDDWRPPAGWHPLAGEAPTESAKLADSTIADLRFGPDTRVKTIAVRRGDTLIDVLTREGAATSEAHAAITALRPLYDPKRLQVGQDLTLTFARFETVPDSNGSQLVTVAIPTDVDRDVTVSRAGSGDFHAKEVVHPLKTGFLRASGTIRNSLFLATTQAGVPVETTLQLIRLFSYDVDFQRDLQPGDHFEVLYRAYYDEDGRAVKTGELLCARLATKGRTFALYRYTTPDGDTDYFDETGRSNKKALMRTPIDGARISSGFGMRHHPILGYSRMHKGLDFAAPTGTPIMAAGDGKVEFAGMKHGYGRYIKLRHSGAYETAYGHMSRIAKNIKPGATVKQGQIIGYVGQSGMATGPHLHYEVLVKGAQMNPASKAVPTNKTLGGKDLVAFRKNRQQVDRRFSEAPSATTVASAQ